MLKISNVSWFACNTRETFALPEVKNILKVSLASLEPVAIIAVSGSEKITIWTGTCTHNLPIQLIGFTGVEFVGKKFGLRVEINGLQISEPINSELPPARPKPANYLQQIREKVRADLGISREAFLANDTDLPGYEIGDDEELMFEEEIATLAAQAQSEPENGGEGSEAPQDAEDPVPAAGEPPSGSEG